LQVLSNAESRNAIAGSGFFIAARNVSSATDYFALLLHQDQNDARSLDPENLLA
jgi:hypothetical protein